MQQIEGYFHNPHNTRIYYQAWLPETPVKAALVVVHGLGEHSGRYAGLARHFTSLGYAVYGFDHTGHGRSDGIRQYIRRFEEFTDTLAAYCWQIEAWQPGVPLFLLGHSMGGLIAAHSALDGGGAAKGVIFSAPSIKASNSIGPGVIWLGKGLSVIAPKFRMLRLDRNGVSRDPAVLVACASDPLVYQGKFTARLGAEVLKAMRRVQAETHKITLPFLVLQGCDDRIVDPAGAQWLYEKAGSKHKTLKLYANMFHEVFNDPERSVVLKDVEDWLADFV